MTPQMLLTLSQAAIALGLIISALGGYGAYYYQKTVDAQEEALTKPTVDLCHRGISVTEVDAEKLYFDIPYCSGKGVNAYNVKLEPAVALRVDGGLKLLSPFGDSFPDGIALSYETGKSMQFTLHPITKDAVNYMYIAVRGSYTNEGGRSTYRVFDIFKLNGIKGEWVRTLGDEDRGARAFFDALSKWTPAK